ncbi:MAG TPA: RIP metalloprotease RseP [Alphaproteobacteria bacterium]|nr:RIP metalloprotease RseP [Alphaproteobacteria bacterium]
MPHILGMAPHYLVPFIIVISVVVFVHEFGHYWVAKRCGIKIETFSIGFGREIFGWTDKHGTRWKVSWLPLGGFVKMYGDGSAASTPDDSVHSMTEEQKRVSFFHQHVDKRMAVVVAGPAFNYLFAVIVLAFLFMFQGQPYSPPNVSTVLPDGVAARAGMQPGDKVVSLDGSKIDRFEDIKRIVALNAGTPIAVQVLRGDTHVDLKITPEIVTTSDRFGGEHKVGRIGITSDNIEYKKWSPPKAVVQAVVETWDLTSGTLRAIGQMIMGTRGTEELGGPLRIAEMSGHVATEGAVALIWFMAVISVNLGLINLFPVPLLDGGHLAFYLAERLRGRPIHENIQEMGARIGLAMVLCLMVFATWNDLVHLKVISYLRGLFS